MQLNSHCHTPPVLSSGKIHLAFLKHETGKIPPLLFMNCGETIMSYYGFNTYSLSYSLTSNFRGCETQWMKALGYSPTDVGSNFTSSSSRVPSVH